MSENLQDSIENDAATEFQALAQEFGLDLRDLWPNPSGTTRADARQGMIDTKEFDAAAIAAVFGIPTEYLNK